MSSELVQIYVGASYVQFWNKFIKAEVINQQNEKQGKRTAGEI
jgi:hypothetical protein